MSAASAKSSLSSASKAAASSVSSASKAASKSLSSGASSGSSAMSSASAKASAAAADNLNKAGEMASQHWGFLTWVAIIITLLAGGLAALYFSGQADPIVEYFAKMYFKAEAKAEGKALEKAGSKQAEDFLKDRLKKNPMMGEDELNQVQKGLGSEAAREGLAGVSSKLGGLGKL